MTNDDNRPTPVRRLTGDLSLKVNRTIGRVTYGDDTTSRITVEAPTYDYLDDGRNLP